MRTAFALLSEANTDSSPAPSTAGSGERSVSHTGNGEFYDSIDDSVLHELGL